MYQLHNSRLIARRRSLNQSQKASEAKLRDQQYQGATKIDIHINMFLFTQTLIGLLANCYKVGGG